MALPRIQTGRLEETSRFQVRNFKKSEEVLKSKTIHLAAPTRRTYFIIA
jgi:hypothetical protein